MKYVRNISLILCFILVSLGIMFSQEEIDGKVAFYDNIFTIDRNLDKKLNYFAPKYENFRSAELLKLSDGQYELEIEKFENGQQVFLTKNLNEQAYRDLRQEIAIIIEQKSVSSSEDNGAKFLKVQSFTLQGISGGLYISSLAAKMQLGAGLAATAPLMGMGAGIVGGIIATSDKNVPLAHSLGYASGASMGILHVLSFNALSIDNLDNQVPALLLTSTVFSVGESLLLQHIVKKYKWNSRRASALRLGNLSGGISGLGLSLMLGGDDPSRFLVSGLTLAGSAGGIIFYDKYFKNKDIATGNMQAIRLMNAVFTIGSTITLAALLEIKSTAARGATILATSIGGVFLGELLFKNGSVTYNESMWYGAGLYVGGLIGLGISLGLLSDNFILSDNNETALFAGFATLFSLGGLYTVHALVSNNDKVEGKLGFFERNNLSINTNLSSLILNKYIEHPALQQSALSISWRF